MRNQSLRPFFRNALPLLSPKFGGDSPGTRLPNGRAVSAACRGGRPTARNDVSPRAECRRTKSLTGRRHVTCNRVSFTDRVIRGRVECVTAVPHATNGDGHAQDRPKEPKRARVTGIGQHPIGHTSATPHFMPHIFLTFAWEIRATQTQKNMRIKCAGVWQIGPWVASDCVLSPLPVWVL